MSSVSDTKPPPLKAASSTTIKVEDVVQRPQPSTIRSSPMAAASPPAGSPSTAVSLLSKEWVIPPRPKPGRKPATDTPPTKRKAQNRAAQRAFRERRAARVGELEEQMKMMEEEDEVEQNKLRMDIDRLEREVKQYRSEVTRWVERCRSLETELSLAQGEQTSTNAMPLSKWTVQRSDAVRVLDTNDTIGCGNCSAETSCECLDEAFNIMSATGSSMPHDKRPHSPASVIEVKRVKIEPNEEREIDFTSTFASRPALQLHRDATDATDVPSLQSGQHDPCGFCSDGTPCVCAQMDAEAGHSHPSIQHSTSSDPAASVAHQLSQQGFTPPPSDGDVFTTGPSEHGTAVVPTNSCISNPGSCAQCRSDPNSTLFCKSLAASRSQSTTAPTNAQCCSAIKRNSASCPCATRSAPAKSQPEIPASGSASGKSIKLSCADAYTTLSRHPGYERAQGEMAGWMGKLLPIPVPAKEGKTAMEIDAANVMTVLKEFDRRFVD